MSHQHDVLNLVKHTLFVALRLDRLSQQSSTRRRQVTHLQRAQSRLLEGSLCDIGCLGTVEEETPGPHDEGVKVRSSVPQGGVTQAPCRVQFPVQVLNLSIITQIIGLIVTAVLALEEVEIHVVSAQHTKCGRAPVGFVRVEEDKLGILFGGFAVAHKLLRHQQEPWLVHVSRGRCVHTPVLGKAVQQVAANLVLQVALVHQCRRDRVRAVRAAPEEERRPERAPFTLL